MLSVSTKDLLTTSLCMATSHVSDLASLIRNIRNELCDENRKSISLQRVCIARMIPKSRIRNLSKNIGKDDIFFNSRWKSNVATAALINRVNNCNHEIIGICRLMNRVAHEGKTC